MWLRSKNNNNIDFEEGTGRGLIVVVFGVRELPNPRGEGYFWYRLHPSGREFFVDYLNLYKTSNEELKELFVLAVQKVRDALAAQGRTKEILTTDYQIENMTDWAVQLLKEIIEIGS